MTESRSTPDGSELYRLPTAARDLLEPLVGSRLLTAERCLSASDSESDDEHVTRHGDRRDAATVLRFANGAVLSVRDDPSRHSLVVAATPHEPPTGMRWVDVSRDEFWRWRLRRDILAVNIWKSLDVRADAGELEFGLEFVLRYTPAFVLEYEIVDGVSALMVSDGSSGERCRKISV